MALSQKVSVEDERFHPGSADPWWNESSFITFRVPERDLLGILYFYFRPNQKMAMGGPIIFDRTGDGLSDCLHCGWTWHMPMPDDAEMFDFRLENGFEVQTIEPQRSYRHVYDDPECGFDLTFVAAREPYYLTSADDDGVAGMEGFLTHSEEVLAGHYEQYGRMNGTLTLRGETINVVDSAVLRDRSWGPRPILPQMRRPRGAYLFGMGSDENAFQVFSLSELPYENDPVYGTTERVVGGFYVKDGEVGDIVSGWRRCIARGIDGRPIREVIEAVDHLGRKLEAEGRVSSLLKWQGGYGDYLGWWCCEQWDFDGHSGAPGELQEYLIARHYRALMAREATEPTAAVSGMNAETEPAMRGMS